MKKLNLIVLILCLTVTMFGQTSFPISKYVERNFLNWNFSDAFDSISKYECDVQSIKDIHENRIYLFVNSGMTFEAVYDGNENFLSASYRICSFSDSSSVLIVKNLTDYYNNSKHYVFSEGKFRPYWTTKVKNNSYRVMITQNSEYLDCYIVNWYKI
jgi:hypothetical protein